MIKNKMPKKPAPKKTTAPAKKETSKPIKKETKTAAKKETSKAGKTTKGAKLLELGLLCDCTSSMWSWIDRAKKTLHEII